MAEIPARTPALSERLLLQSPKPFSTQGFESLEAEIESYISDLIDEAVKIARRYRADDISATHVIQAAQNLTASAKHRIYRHLGTTGGVFLGAGLSSVLTITTAPPPIPMVGFLLSIAFTAIGAFLVAMHIVRE